MEGESVCPSGIAYIPAQTSTNKKTISKEEETVIENLFLGEDKESVKPSGEDYSKLSLAELNKLLDEAVNNENYEKAASVRDEISKRQ